MTCDDINKYIESFIDIVLSPVELTVNEVNLIKDSAYSLFNEKNF